MIPFEFELEMPSDEDLRASAVKWREQLVGTNLDELSPEMMALSVKTDFVPTNPNDWVEVFDGKPDGLLDLIAEAETHIGWGSKFIKLNTRSAKDAYDASGLTVSAKQAVYWMSGSERILDDICRLVRVPEVPAFLCIREPFFGINGLGSWEFRCFVKGGDLVAVTDYDYKNPNPHIMDCETRAKIYAEIVEFFGKIRTATDLQDYVFDLCKTRSGWVLIEVNPYGLSDPCFLRNYEGVEAFKGDIAFGGAA